MGKGSRNRQRHVQEQLNSSARQNKQAKKAPKWLTPLISILLAAVILVGLIASVLTNSGIIYRNRIIVESKTGNYDITQQTGRAPTTTLTTTGTTLTSATLPTRP